MALSKIYQQRLEQLHEDVYRSLLKKISNAQPDFYKPFDIETQTLYQLFLSAKEAITIEDKIELLTKLEEL